MPISWKHFTENLDFLLNNYVSEIKIYLKMLRFLDCISQLLKVYIWRVNKSKIYVPAMTTSNTKWSVIDSLKTLKHILE
jgi:hypothetical protein